jgi:phage/plasmid primase-like uncharacterized protein
MTYMSESHLVLQVHDHATNQTCHWMSIFKPLSFVVFRDAQLAQKILHGIMPGGGGRFDAGDFRGYGKWLCEFGGNDLLNLITVFLLVCELRGSPQAPVLDVL